MNAVAGNRRPLLVPATVIAGALAVLAAAVASGGSPAPAVGLVILATLAAVVPFLYVGWPRILATLILIILFIPIRRYSLPGNLPFELEPYRVFVALLVLGWLASLLADPRSRVRKTGFEGPLILIIGSALASIAANPDRVAQFSPFVDKKLMFFISFVIVLYVIASTIRRLADIDYLAKTLVVGGATVGLFAIVESRTGFNIFNHLDRAIPVLQAGGEGEPEAFQKFGAAKLRVFGSAQHPIALSAAFVVLTPLAVYLAYRYRQRRWYVCAALLIAGCAATVSRTGVVMLVVVALVFLWLRPKEVRRLWPVLIPAAHRDQARAPGNTRRDQAVVPSRRRPDRRAEAHSPARAAAAASQTSARRCRSGDASRSSVRDSALASSTPMFRAGRRTSSTTSGSARCSRPGSSGSSAGSGSSSASSSIRQGGEERTTPPEAGCSCRSRRASLRSASGMFTYDAFAFIQVTFLLFIFVGLGSALLAERPTPLASPKPASRDAVASAYIQLTSLR